jgi:hypothetical protein
MPKVFKNNYFETGIYFSQKLIFIIQIVNYVFKTKKKLNKKLQPLKCFIAIPN